MLVTVFVFLGIEGASIYSRYATNRKDVGLATVFGFIGVLCLLMLVTMLSYGVMPQATVTNMVLLTWEKIDLKRGGSPAAPPQKLSINISFLNAIIRMAINTKIGMILAQVARVLIKAASLIPRNTRR